MSGQVSTKSVAVIGELNVDLVATGLASAPIFGQEILVEDFQMTLGSASAIFACGVSKLEHQVTFVSRVGQDDFGEFCVEALRNAGISTAQVVADQNLKTGVTISLSTPHDRALVTFLGAIGELEINQIPLDVLEGHSHLHLTSYFLQHKLRVSFAAIFEKARSYGLTTSLDPNSDPTSEWNESIWDVLAQTDVLFVNEQEAKQLTRCDEASDALKHLSAKLPCAVIKLGSRGAVAVRNNEVVFAPSFATKAVDTTGAGDSFAAGFIHGYLMEHDLTTCLRFGNACGAVSTLKAGGTASQLTRAGLHEFLQTHHHDNSAA